MKTTSFESLDEPLKKPSSSSIPTPFTEKPIASSETAIEYKAGPDVEIVRTKSHPKKSKVEFKEYNRRFMTQSPNFGRLSPYSSHTILSNYNDKSQSQISELNANSQKTFLNSQIGESAPSLSNFIDINNIGQESGISPEKLEADDSKYYGNYFENYFTNMKHLYGTSKQPEDIFVNPQLKKIYSNTPLSYSLSYESDPSRNSKAFPKPIFSSDLKSKDCV